MDGGTLLLLIFVSGLYWIVVESETVGCDVATLTLGSNRTYTFADCHNWDNGSGISVPVLIVAQSLVNVTVSVVRCSSLPFLRVLEGFTCTVPPDDVPDGIGGLNVTVQDVTMDSTKPMISSQSSGVLATRWTVPACVPTVFILMRDSVLFIDGSGVTPANQPTYVPSPFLHVEVSNIHVGLVMQNVSITAYTNFAQSLVTFSCLNAVVLSSSVYVSMHNVSIDMVGRALNYSQLRVITVRENHILQTVLEFETTLIALENISIFMSGDCSFRVHFGLDTLNTSLLSSDALSASYYAFVVHAQSQSSSRGITLRNFSLVLSEKGSYYSEVQGSQYVSMIMVKELEGLADALIVLRNLVVHHTVTQFINIHVDTLISRYGSVVHVSCWTSAYVNITIHNITARIEGYSGMPAGLTSPTLMPGVIVSLITQEVTLLTFGTIDVRHAVAVMTLVNGSAPSIPFVAQVASLSFSVVAVNARFKVINSTISLSENTLVSHAGVLFAEGGTAPALMSLNVLTSLIGLSGNCTNISITVINSDVLLASYSCSALSTMLLNMTGIVSLANMASAAAAAAPALAALQGSQPNEVTSAVLRMINTSVRSMATSGLQATGTDYRGHLILPPTASNITVVVLYPMQASSNTIVCPMTDCNLSTSTIAVSYASGSGLFVSAANTVSIHSSSLNISRSSLVSPTAGQQNAVIGRKNSSSPNALVWGGDGSQVTFGHSNFSGFAQLVGGTPAAWCSNGQPDLLTINCVEWNGGPVPEHSIPSPTSCLVAQRPTQVECPSLEPPVMPSQSASILSVANTATLVRAESLLTIIKQVSTDTSAAMIYTAIVVGGSVLSRGTIPNLQRASSALRLAALCNQAGDDSSSNAADAPLLADLADNPLLLQIHSVGGPSMSYAAGAVVGNAVLVVGIGLVLHAVAMLEKTMKKALKRHGGDSSGSRLQNLAVVLLVWLPSALLPGAFASTYGTMLQPSLSGCIALIVSEEGRTAGSVAYAVVMLILWCALPVYCSWVVLYRGRQTPNGSFLLQTRRTVAAVVSSERRGKPKTEGSALIRALGFMRRLSSYWLDPTQRWYRPGGYRGGVAQQTYAQQAEFLLENMEPVFGGYVEEREWYFIIDWGLSLTSGCVLGAAQALATDASSHNDRVAACDAATWGTACALCWSVAQIVVCVTLRPLSVRFELYSVLGIGLLGFVSEVLLLLNLDDAADAVVVFANIATVIALVVLTLHVTTRVANTAEPIQKRFTASAQSETKEHRHHHNRQSDATQPGKVSHKEAPHSIPQAPPSRAIREQLHRLVQLACDGKVGMDIVVPPVWPRIYQKSCLPPNGE